jgi:hypothetical protein
MSQTPYAGSCGQQAAASDEQVGQGFYVTTRRLGLTAMW